MRIRSLVTAATAACAFGIGSLGAAVAHQPPSERAKIGLVLTLSGPIALNGQHARDGFQLALRELNGRLGRREVEVVTVDDEAKPDVAVTKVRGLLDRDRVDLVVGPMLSNILLAVHKPVMDAGKILISPNPGPSTFAGKGCHPNFFVTSYQNDQMHEVMGKVAQDRGYKRVYLLAPNYQAGKDALAGFKRQFKGEVVDESYVPLNTLDFQSELAKLAELKPDALYTFMPGGMGVNLVRQFAQAGLKDRVPFLSAATVDEVTLPAQQETAVGLFGGSTWAPDSPNPQSRRFVEAFEKAFGYVPGVFAMQAYDTALLIDSAMRATNGATRDREALREAIRTAEFPSLRGTFKFNVSGYPVQDFFLTKVEKRPDGKFQTAIVEKVFENLADAYAGECKPAF